MEKGKKIIWGFLLVIVVLLVVLIAVDSSTITGLFDPIDTGATFESAVEGINNRLNSFAWGPIMLALLVGSGIAFTIFTGFFQFGKFGHVWKNTIGKIFKKKDPNEEVDKGAISPFQALTTAMAATVGTGNIAGVTGAIVLGGPGAVFWMWVSALFGMATKYAEVVLAVKYREKNEKGEWVGGPMYYIKNGLGKNWKWLAIVFSVLGALAAFGIGNMTQVNTIANSIVTAVDNVTHTALAEESAMTIRWVVGGIIAVLAGLVIIGGIKRIGKVTEKLVPFMSIFYIIGALVIIFANIGSIGRVFSDIFVGAFTPEAFIGGVAGTMIMIAIKRGVGRGVFSNEAGLGSAPIAHAATSETNPVKQGLYGVFEVFMDTLVLCTLTALVVLISGITQAPDFFQTAVPGAATTTIAYGTVFGDGFASIFIAVAILCFAFSTVLSWGLYGERCFGFLTNYKGIRIYQIIFILVILVGATSPLPLIWDIADTLNGLMAIPNLIALVALSGVVIRLTKEYKTGLRESNTK